MLFCADHVPGLRLHDRKVSGTVQALDGFLPRLLNFMTGFGALDAEAGRPRKMITLP